MEIRPKTGKSLIDSGWDFDKKETGSCRKQLPEQLVLVFQGLRQGLLIICCIRLKKNFRGTFQNISIPKVGKNGLFFKSWKMQECDYFDFIQYKELHNYNGKKNIGNWSIGPYKPV